MKLSLLKEQSTYIDVVGGDINSDDWARTISPYPCVARSGVAATRIESCSRSFHVLILTLVATVRMVDLEETGPIPCTDFAGEFGDDRATKLAAAQTPQLALHCGCQPFMASLLTLNFKHLQSTLIILSPAH